MVSGDRTGGKGQDLGQTAGEHEVDDDSQCYSTDQNRDEGDESDRLSPVDGSTDAVTDGHADCDQREEAEKVEPGSGRHTPVSAAPAAKPIVAIARLRRVRRLLSRISFDKRM